MKVRSLISSLKKPGGTCQGYVVKKVVYRANLACANGVSWRVGSKMRLIQGWVSHHATISFLSHSPEYLGCLQGWCSAVFMYIENMKNIFFFFLRERIITLERMSLGSSEMTVSCFFLYHTYKRSCFSLQKNKYSVLTVFSLNAFILLTSQLWPCSAPLSSSFYLSFQLFKSTLATNCGLFSLRWYPRHIKIIFLEVMFTDNPMKGELEVSQKK